MVPKDICPDWRCRDEDVERPNETNIKTSIYRGKAAYLPVERAIEALRR